MENTYEMNVFVWRSISVLLDGCINRSALAEVTRLPGPIKNIYIYILIIDNVEKTWDKDDEKRPLDA